MPSLSLGGEQEATAGGDRLLLPAQRNRAPDPALVTGGKKGRRGTILDDNYEVSLKEDGLPLSQTVPLRDGQALFERKRPVTG